MSIDIFAIIKYVAFNDTGIVELNESPRRCRNFKQVRDTGIVKFMISGFGIPDRDFHNFSRTH